MCRITWVALYAELFQTDGAHVNERETCILLNQTISVKDTGPIRCVCVCVCVNRTSLHAASRWSVASVRHWKACAHIMLFARLILHLCRNCSNTKKQYIYICFIRCKKHCIPMYVNLPDVTYFRTLNCNSCWQFVLMSLMIITHDNWLIWNWCDVYRTCVNLVETVKTFHTRFIMR